VNAWIIAQYSLTRQKVEGVPELDWLRTLLARGCPLDAFTCLVENTRIPRNSSSSLSDEFKLGTFQFDAAAAWVDKMLRKWDLAQLPNDAQFIVTLNTHHRRGDTPSRVRTGRSKDVRTIGRTPGVLLSISGYASNGQYYTGLTDQREPAEQCSAADSTTLSDAWVARRDIDIEEIIRVVLKSAGPIDMKIAEANATTKPSLCRNRATENPRGNDRLGCCYNARCEGRSFDYDASFQLHHKKPGTSVMVTGARPFKNLLL
jgi:hypothetical protein